MLYYAHVTATTAWNEEGKLCASIYIDMHTHTHTPTQQVTVINGQSSNYMSPRNVVNES